VPEIKIVDTSPRDGPVALPHIETPEKVALANQLIQSGSLKLDCAAFTHPRIKAEYADAEKVVNALNKRPGVSLIGIAPNEIASRRALNTQVDEIGILLAASESFNHVLLGQNLRTTLYKTIPAIIQACREKGKKTRAYLGAAFHCPYDGRVPLKDLGDLVNKLLFLGVDEISLVDTIGMANPKQVKETLTFLKDHSHQTRLAVHFHNTRGLGIANCLAAYDAGIRTFDTAIGGLSGTPFGVPKMGIGCWNIPTEDLVFLFSEMGIMSGINLEALLDAVRLAQQIAGQDLQGHILNARDSFVSSNFPEPIGIAG